MFTVSILTSSECNCCVVCLTGRWKEDIDSGVDDDKEDDGDDASEEIAEPVDVVVNVVRIIPEGCHSIIQ